MSRDELARLTGEAQAKQAARERAERRKPAGKPPKGINPNGRTVLAEDGALTAPRVVPHYTGFQEVSQPCSECGSLMHLDAKARRYVCEGCGAVSGPRQDSQEPPISQRETSSAPEKGSQDQPTGLGVLADRVSAKSSTKREGRFWDPATGQCQCGGGIVKRSFAGNRPELSCPACGARSCRDLEGEWVRLT